MIPFKYLLSIILLFLLMNTQIGFSQQKVLIEEVVGTWCPWCPQGVTFGKLVQQTYPDNVLISAVHINDDMETQDGYFDSLGLFGLPTSALNRKMKDIKPKDWLITLSSLLDEPSISTLEIQKNYNSSTRELSVTICATFNDSILNGKFSLAAILIEDGVTGEPPSYSQENIYSGGDVGPMGGWEDKPKIVNAENMVYDHVNRGLLTDYHGIENSIPSHIESNTPYCKTILVPLEDHFNDHNIRVYAMIINQSNGEIQNSNVSEYANGSKNALPFIIGRKNHQTQIGLSTKIKISVHDTDCQSITMNPKDLPDWLTFLPINDHEAILVGDAVSTGLYNIPIEISDGVDMITDTIHIEVKPDNIGWVQMGESLFSEEESEYQCLAAINPQTDELFSMGITSSNKVFSYQFINENWEKAGVNNTAFPLFGAINIHPITGNPWRFHREINDSAVYEYTNGIWNKIGKSIPLTSYHNIQFNATGQVFICGYKSSLGIQLYSLENNNWTPLPVPKTGNNLSKCQLLLNSNGELFMLLAAFINGKWYSRLFTFTEQEWIAIGTFINEEKPTAEKSLTFHKLAITASGKIYVAIGHEEGINLYSYDDSTWNLFEENIDHGSSLTFDLKTNQVDELFFTFLTHYSRPICLKWSSNEWSTLGIPEFTNTILNFSLFLFSDGNPGIIYLDQSESIGRFGAKRFEELFSPVVNVAQMNDSIEIQPNPVGEILNLKSTFKEIGMYVIFDISGNHIKSGYTSQNSIYVEHLQKGSYYLVIEGIKTIKFIKM